MMETLPSIRPGDVTNALKPAGAGTSSADGADFAQMLESLAAGALGQMRDGEAAAAAGLKGELPLDQVATKVMAAEQALHAAIAVRDKIVAAYLEVSRMTI